MILFAFSTPLSFAEEPQRATKGPWFGVFTHTGQTNPQERWSGFDALISDIIKIKKGNPHISGVTIKILWKHINPAKNEYDFRGLDELLEVAKKNNISVILSVFTGNRSAPDWIYEERAKKFISSATVNGEILYGPVPWDEKYMQLLEACLKALAEKINKDPRIFAVGVSGHNFVGGEMIMAHANSSRDLQRWDELGRTDEVIFNNWKHWIDLYASLFSDKQIILTLGPMYGEGKRIGYLMDELAQYAVDKYGDRVVLQHMSLHGRFDGLGICWEHDNLDKCADCQIRNRDRVSSGFETLGSFVNQPARQGNVEMTVYNALKANPLYIQLWHIDAFSAEGVEIARQIEELYQKYNNFTLEEIKDDLEKQGKYLQNYRWEGKKKDKRKGKIDLK